MTSPANIIPDRRRPSARGSGAAWRRSLHALAAAAARLGRSARASTATEFALTAPVLILLMLASVELARFVILNQKLDRVALTMSDLVARAETINQSDIDDIFIAAGEVAQPFSFQDTGRVIVSSITNPAGSGARVAWQRSGAGTFSATSHIGSQGGLATLPAGFVVRQGETAIISEVFYGFQPFLSELIVGPQTVYKRAHHRPRLGTLDTIGAG